MDSCANGHCDRRRRHHRPVARPQSAQARNAPAAFSSAPRKSGSSASASRCCPMRCGNSRRSASRTSSSAPASPIRESCFFNRFGQLIYREDRGRLRRLPVSRGEHPSRPPAHDPAAGGDRPPRRRRASSLDRECVAVEQDEAGVTLRLRETTSGATLDGVRADVGDRLRRRQLRAAQAILSGRRGRLRRHQHLARHHPPQAVPHRPLLHPHRLDPDRQDGDLSDHRQRRWRRQPADQLDGGDQAGHLREERLEPARQPRRFLRPLSGLAFPLARRRRT